MMKSQVTLQDIVAKATEELGPPTTPPQEEESA
jgi:hypothetical protein